MTRKERLAELARKLRDAAKLHDPVATATVELLQLTIDDLKESLVNAVDDDMLRVQGAARQLIRLHKDLTTSPPTISPEN